MTSPAHLSSDRRRSAGVPAGDRPSVYDEGPGRDEPLGGLPAADLPRRDGEVALVTGANRGLGLALTAQLARLGLHVVMGCRSVPAGEAARERLGDVAHLLSVRELDVTRDDSVAELMHWMRRELGRCDVLVNNAAISVDNWEAAAVLDLDVARRTLETNLLGGWRMTQAVAPAMRAHRHGRVVNVSSKMGQTSYMGRDLPAYRVSKIGLNALTMVFADELYSAGILVNCFCPGRVATDLFDLAGGRSPAVAADTGVWLGTLPAGGPTGGFFRRREPMPW